MTNDTWKMLITAIASINNRPLWLDKISRLTCEEVSRLPSLDEAGEGQFTIPSLETKPVTEDYLVFLREQIQLSPRGPEWTEILLKRLNALQPFIGKHVLTATFHELPHSITLRINPETGNVFHSEIY